MLALTNFSPQPALPAPAAGRWHRWVRHTAPIPRFSQLSRTPWLSIRCRTTIPNCWRRAHQAKPDRRAGARSSDRPRKLCHRPHRLQLVRQGLAFRPLRCGLRHASLHDKRSPLARNRHHQGQFRFCRVPARRFSPTLVNLAHASFSRTWESASVQGSPTVNNGVVSPGTLTSSGVHPLQFFGTGEGREDGTISTFSGVTAIGASTTLPFYLVPNKFAYGDDVIWTRGAHSVKFGGTATRLRGKYLGAFRGRRSLVVQLHVGIFDGNRADEPSSGGGGV